MPAAVAIPAIIGAGTSIASGVIGSKAAGSAARTQAEGAAAAGQMVTNAANTVNPQIQAAGEAAQTGMNTAVTQAQTGVTGAAETAATGVTTAAQQAGQGVTDAATDANTRLAAILEAIQNGTNPYATAGTDAIKQLAEGLQPGGEFRKDFEFTEDDPSYRFRMTEARKAFEASAAARGTALGGGALKALEQYSQNLASTEFGASFDRFERSTARKYNMAAGVAGMGQNAMGQQIGAGVTLGGLMSGNITRAAEYSGNAGMTGATTAGGFRTNAAEYSGNAGMSGAQYSGNVGMTSAAQQAANTMGAAEAAAGYRVGAANATAAGTIGRANAWSGALGGIANTAQKVGDYYTLQSIMKPKTN